MESLDDSRVYKSCYNKGSLKNNISQYLGHLSQTFHGFDERCDGTYKTFLGSCI